MALTYYWERIKESRLIKHIAILAGGTAFAQLITVLILPVLTRLYSPAEFAVFAVYAALLSILAVAASLRLDIAIPIPQDDHDAANIAILALVVSLFTSLLVAIPAVFYSEKISFLLGQPQIEPYLWLVPVGVCLASAYNVLQFWATRKKDFSIIAQTRMAQAVAAAGVQVGVGLWGGSSLGLILGHILNNGAGVAGIGVKSWRQDRRAFASVNIPHMLAVLRQYKRFPKYSALEALANSAAIQLPVMLIAAYAIGPEAGYLVLAMQVMQAPMSLIGNAVAQVYLSNAPDALRRGSLPEFTATMLDGLMKTGVGPLLFAGIVAPEIFGLIFGRNWYRAGELVTWMTPWFVAQFLVSPISMALHVKNKQPTALCLQLVGLALRLMFVVIAALWLNEYIAELYALSGLVFYSLYLVVVLMAVSMPLKTVFSLCKSSWLIIVIWLICGLSVRYLVGLLVAA